MAKKLLDGYRIGGDIIDRLSADPPPSSPPSSLPNPADMSAGSPSAGAPETALSRFPSETTAAAFAVSSETAVAQGPGAQGASKTGQPGQPGVTERLAATELRKPTPTAGTIEQTWTTAPLHQPPESEQTETFESAQGDDEQPASEAADEEIPGDDATHEAAGGQAAADPEPDPPAFAVTKDGLFQVFTINGTTYRVGGVKALFVTSLRVNIRASAGDQTYYDSLDLYSAKGRSGYALALNRGWGLEPVRVERDLIAILEHLEKERDEQLRAGNRKPVIEITPEDRQIGLELLQDPHIFDRITADLSALGYVGEDLNKQLLYLCGSSRKLDDPISVLILSQSASGKSFLVDSVKKLMPAEDVVAVTSLSDQALNYIDDLMHKFLVLGEAVHGETVEHQIREMLSGKELSRMVAIKDPETGKLATQIVRTPVIVASVMSGTNHAINPENASRCFIINTDETKDQTARIHAQQRGKYSLDRLRTGTTQTQRVIRAHQAAQRLLRPLHIVNDFAPLLDFPVNLMRLRRDHDRFLDLIACVCFLRQYQKPQEAAGNLPFIRCDLVDYGIAYRIMVEGVLASTVRELPKGAVSLYEDLRDWAKREAIRQDLKLTEVSFTQREVRELTGLSHTWVQVGLRQLVEYEYLTVRGGGPRSKGHYRLLGDEGIQGADLSMIPTPAIMKTLWESRI